MTDAQEVKPGDIVKIKVGNDNFYFLVIRDPTLKELVTVCITADFTLQEGRPVTGWTEEDFVNARDSAEEAEILDIDQREFWSVVRSD